MTLPWCGLAVDHELELLNGPALVVRGRRRYAPPPTLFSTAVRGELDLTATKLLSHLLLPGRRLTRRSHVLGGLSRAQFEYLGHEDRRYGEQVAVHAACAFLGLAVQLGGHGARVLDVAVGSPSDGVLHPGDVLLAVDGTQVEVASQAAAALRRSDRRVLSCLVLRADRHGGGGGAPQEVPISRPKDVSAGGAPFGLRLTTHRPALSSPVDLDFELDPDGAGPSAGLMLTLAVLDVLTPGSLTAGRRVAGTGTIGLDGAVGTVDWVDFKARAALRGGAEIFLAPSGTIPQAMAGSRGKLSVVGVDSLSDAVTALVSLGGSRPVLPAIK